MRRRNPLETIARARDEAMADRAKQVCEMAPNSPPPASRCNCPGGSHKGFTGCPLNSDPRYRGTYK